MIFRPTLALIGTDRGLEAALSGALTGRAAVALLHPTEAPARWPVGLAPVALLDLPPGQRGAGVALGLALRARDPAVHLIVHAAPAEVSVTPPQGLWLNWLIVQRQEPANLVVLVNAALPGLPPPLTLGARDAAVWTLLAGGQTDVGIARQLACPEAEVVDAVTRLYVALNVNAADPAGDPRVQATLAYLRYGGPDGLPTLH